MYTLPPRIMFFRGKRVYLQYDRFQTHLGSDFPLNHDYGRKGIHFWWVFVRYGHLGS